MDPDLAITIGFVGEVLLFALAFTFYVVRETHKAHAESERAPERPDQRGTR